MHGITLEPPFRRATPDDAHALAELINFAGEGLPSYLWQQMAEAGESVWDVGRRRARREEGGFSYRNAVVFEKDGQVAACLIGYPLPEEPEPIDYDGMPAMFVPMQELENLAPGTWYVNVLATYPEHRGSGHGTRLLELAERLATVAGSRGLSIIVSNANAGARRLYERCGYRVAAERPMVKESWENAGTSWVLLLKPARDGGRPGWLRQVLRHAPRFLSYTDSSGGRSLWLPAFAAWQRTVMSSGPRPWRVTSRRTVRMGTH